MRKLLLIFGVVALSACDKETMEPKLTIDQCLRAQLFNQCIKTLPPGPLATKYNDWDEVVSECGSQSRNLSYRNREFVKPECRGD
jgi:hypothetical protein